MIRINIEKEGQRLFKNLKQFLTSKDLLIFLSFLFISASLWVLQALNKKYETMANIPVVYTNLPNGYIVTDELPNSLHITIVGQGTNLVRYRWGGEIEPLEIDLSFIENGTRFLKTNAIISKLQKQIKSETIITKISPDTLFFNVEKLAEKSVIVKIDGQFDLAQQYTYCDSIEFNPYRVIAYGPRPIIKQLDTVHCHPIISEIKDTLVTKIKLDPISNVTFSDSIIQLTIRTERFTEKTLQVPISIVHLPQNRNLKIFPSNVSLTCKVGLSNYEKIDASSFTFVVDYNDTKEKTEKLNIQIGNAPSEVFGIKLKPETVDYIIEEKKQNQQE